MAQVLLLLIECEQNCSQGREGGPRSLKEEAATVASPVSKHKEQGGSGTEPEPGTGTFFLPRASVHATQ